MSILALDLGTSTGAAGEWGSETWLLASDSNLRAARKLRLDRRLDIRAVRLWAWLADCHEKRSLDFIAFEDVRFGKSLCQVQLWSSFRGVVWAFAVSRGLTVDCLDTGKLKEFGTGFPHASKSMMGAALVKKHPTRYVLENGLVKCARSSTLLSDDEVDALHLYDWALTLKL